MSKSVKLTALDGTDAWVNPDEVLDVREYPAGQTWIDTQSPTMPVVQVQEDVPTVNRLLGR
jgi:hypothetical protein